MAKLIAALVVTFFVSALVGFAYSATYHPRTCFTAAEWSGPDKYRPCVRVTRLYEDGSFKYAVSDANGTVRYSGGVGAADR